MSRYEYAVTRDRAGVSTEPSGASTFTEIKTARYCGKEYHAPFSFTVWRRRRYQGGWEKIEQYECCYKSRRETSTQWQRVK